MDETTYLLSRKANARRIKESMEQAARGEFVVLDEKNPSADKKEEGLNDQRPTTND
jgi:hypothetical protein